MPMLETERLALFPLPPAAAAALPDNRDQAATVIGASLAPDWPQPELLDVLPIQAATAADDADFGVWVIVEQASDTVVGDIGFFGSPTVEGTVEIGYGVVPDRRRRGYATEAAAALIAWVRAQPNVSAVLARCDEDNVPSIRMLERLGFSQTGKIDQLLAWRL
jgi:[ribosomal protein S5]-alanine N-acetyltransferase